jgi:DNA-binding NarL/FixJ family response regulator
VIAASVGISDFSVVEHSARQEILARYAERAREFEALRAVHRHSAHIESRPPEKSEFIDLTPGRPAPLSAREIEVLELMADGLTNIQIAKRLFITPNTSTSHTRNFIAKLGVRCRAHAVASGFRHGIIN